MRKVKNMNIFDLLKHSAHSISMCCSEYSRKSKKKYLNRETPPQHKYMDGKVISRRSVSRQYSSKKQPTTDNIWGHSKQTLTWLECIWDDRHPNTKEGRTYRSLVNVNGLRTGFKRDRSAAILCRCYMPIRFLRVTRYLHEISKVHVPYIIHDGWTLFTFLDIEW